MALDRANDPAPPATRRDGFQRAERHQRSTKPFFAPVPEPLRTNQGPRRDGPEDEHPCGRPVSGRDGQAGNPIRHRAAGRQRQATERRRQHLNGHAPRSRPATIFFTRGRGEGAHQDGRCLDAVADRSVSRPCVQSPALPWTSQARCQRLGQLPPLRSPRPSPPEHDLARCRSSRCILIALRTSFRPWSNHGAHRPSDRHRPGLDAAASPLWTTVHPFPFLSKLAPVSPSSATLGFRPALVFLVPSAVRPLAPTI